MFKKWIQDVCLEEVVLPAGSTVLWWWIAIAVGFSFVFECYPAIFGVIVGKMLSWTLALRYLSDQLPLYEAVKDLLNIFYLVTSVAILDFVVLLFMYKVLDEVQGTNGGWNGVARVSWNVLWRLLLWQVLLGVLISLCCTPIKEYSCLYLMPQPFTSLPGEGFVTAMWLVSLVWYAFAYAISKPKSKVFKTGWLLIKNCPSYWFVLGIIVFLIAWAPAAFLDSWEVKLSSKIVFVYIFAFSLLHVSVWTVLLVYFFNVPEEWGLEESDEA